MIGNLGADVETRYTTKGTAVANFRIATNETFNDAQGQRQERTEWHRIVAWGRLAETCAQYLSKGRQVCVEGKLQTRQWNDRDGNTRYTTEVVAVRVEFLGGARRENVQSRATEHEVPEATLPQVSEEAQQLLGVGDDVPF